MSALADIIKNFQRLDREYLNPNARVMLPESLQALLREDRLRIADVGAAGGVDPRWDSVREIVEFQTFEPRTEEAEETASGDKNFPICLGKAKERKALFVTRFGQSSSMRKIDMERMAPFAVRDCFQVVEEFDVEVDTMDRCLAAEAKPDFIKLDVEGGELEVLQGAPESLRAALGLRVEISFMTRHQDTPYFGEIDAFLRERGFVLFTLSRELMIRANFRHTPVSNPQVVWGDAIYFLGKNEFLARLRSLGENQKKILVTKFLVLLLAHRAHDYACEILEASAPFVEQAAREPLRKALDDSLTAESNYFPKVLVGTLLACGVYVATFPIPAARAAATFYLKRRAGYLFFYLWRKTARGGELNASVSDLLT